MTGKKKKLTALVAIAAGVVLLGGTFAWFSASDSAKNTLNMGTTNAVITEEFTPVTVIPGAEVTKKVGVTNTGDTDILVRMKMTEDMKTLVGELGTNDPLYADTIPGGAEPATVSQETIDNMMAKGFTKDDTLSQKAGVNVLKATVSDATGDSTQYFAYKVNGTVNEVAKYDAKTSKVTYGYYKVGVDLTDTAVTYVNGQIVNEALNTALSKTFHDDIVAFKNLGTANWTYYEGYFYYKTLLSSGATTNPLIEGLVFNKNMDNAFKGATYSLTPTMDALQATPEAAADQWGVQVVINGNDVAVSELPQP